MNKLSERSRRSLRLALAIGCGWSLLAVATALLAAYSERTTRQVPAVIPTRDRERREPLLVSVPLGVNGRLVQVDVTDVRLALEGAPTAAAPNGVCHARLDWERLATALAPGRQPPSRPLPDVRKPGEELETRVGDWDVRLDPGRGYFDLARRRVRGIRSSLEPAPVDVLWERARPILDGLGVQRSEANLRAHGPAVWADGEGRAEVDLTVGDVLTITRHFGGIPVLAADVRVRYRVDGTPWTFEWGWNCIDPARVVLPVSTKTPEDAARIGLAVARWHRESLKLDFDGSVDVETYFALEDPVGGVYGLRLRGRIGVYNSGPHRHYQTFDFDVP